MAAETIDQIAWAAAVLTAAVAAVFDFREGRIPNWLVYTSLVLALGFFTFTTGLEGFSSAAIGAVTGGAVFFVLFLAGAGGGGDVKLFAALGGWLFAAHVLEVCVYAIMATAMYALTRLTWQGKLGKTLKNSFWLFANVFLPKSKKKELKSETLELVRLGPPTLVGAVAAAWLHFSGS